jgi:hypothetical protein
LSDPLLADEIDSIRAWLVAHPDRGSETSRLMTELSGLEEEASRRLIREQEAAAKKQRIAEQTANVVKAVEAGRIPPWMKVFPFLPTHGLGALLPWDLEFDQAPIMARREGDSIVVQQPMNSVYATKRFAKDAKRLPIRTFTNEGLKLKPRELVGVRLYDEGGKVVVVYAEDLLKFSDASDMAVYKGIVSTALGVWGGALAGKAVSGFWAARAGVAGGAAGLSSAPIVTRVVVGGMTGGTLGAGTSGLTTAIVNAPALARGDMSLRQYGKEVGSDTWSGGKMGFAMGAGGTAVGAGFSKIIGPPKLPNVGKAPPTTLQKLGQKVALTTKLTMTGVDKGMGGAARSSYGGSAVAAETSGIRARPSVSSSPPNLASEVPRTAASARPAAPTPKAPVSAAAPPVKPVATPAPATPPRISAPAVGATLSTSSQSAPKPTAPPKAPSQVAPGVLRRKPSGAAQSRPQVSQPGSTQQVGPGVFRRTPAKTAPSPTSARPGGSATTTPNKPAGQQQASPAKRPHQSKWSSEEIGNVRRKAENRPDVPTRDRAEGLERMPESVGKIRTSHDAGVEGGRQAAAQQGITLDNWNNPRAHIHEFGRNIDDIGTRGANKAIVEYKGETSQLSRGQMQEEWMGRKFGELWREGATAKVTELIDAARQGRLEGWVFRTKIEPGGSLSAAVEEGWPRVYDANRIMTSFRNWFTSRGLTPPNI